MWVRPVSRALAVLALGAVAAFALSPDGRYLLRAAWEESKILARRRPISEMIADSATPPHVRERLRLVQAARTFAHDSLGLATGRSFTAYSRLDRDTLVLVLSGAYRDRLKPYTWWFPVVGRVPYKGYFDFNEARNQARQLIADGFDARLGAASAFSTLGWFNDPVLPTTLRADSLTVANTVIHELTHNTFYAPGSAVFNESFANFVGSRGAERFFRSRGELRAADETAARWRDDKILGRFWQALYATVDSVFNAHPGEEPQRVAERITLRDSIYAAAREQLIHDVGPQLRTISPRMLERVRLDNAVLMSRRVYVTGLDEFDAVLDRDGGDLRRAVRDIIAAVKGRERTPFRALRSLIAR